MSDDEEKAMAQPLELLIRPTRHGSGSRFEVEVRYEGFCGVGRMRDYLGDVQSYAVTRTQRGARRKGARMIAKIERARRWMAQDGLTVPAVSGTPADREKATT